ncbi:MAG TPA: F0F1 ATP synthase subunit B [Afifellaceae bacterium]|nr:F0F1 ATP synthase subunit B [Afifellaceae bacterium]
MAEQSQSETVATTEVPGGEAHGAFPPFDPDTFGSQLFWLAVTFGVLYYLMAKVALPRIGTIIEERNDRIANDLAEAEKLKRETDEAIATYEQALAEARQNAHGIAHAARDKAKAKIDAGRDRIEADLGEKIKAAEAEIATASAGALADLETIARDAAEALVQELIGEGAGKTEIAAAVDAVLKERL